MRNILFIVCICSAASCNSQTGNENTVSGNTIKNDVLPACEWCGADEVPENTTWKTTLAPADEPGERITISGTVYRSDKVIPAPNVIIYVYHTNAKGIYPKKGNETGNAKRHGYLRGWMKTDANGKYEFMTIKPGAYPGGGNPAHIHMTVKEEGKDEYWLDEYLFGDDPVLLNEIEKGKFKKPAEDNFNFVLNFQKDANGNLNAVRDLVLH
ncbi:MAG: intradiol ring-cleavage dioxygenase [Chitinophagales bacterium]|nr:intradiol ring-cleavage dioxygenase [Chitinophagales bacterium]